MLMFCASIALILRLLKIKKFPIFTEIEIYGIFLWENKELEFDIFYSGEEDLGSTAILDIGNTPEMVFTIGTADCRASLGLCLLALDDSDA